MYEHDELAEAVKRAAAEGAPAKTWDVGPEVSFDYGTGRNPFDGMTVTHWTRD